MNAACFNTWVAASAGSKYNTRAEIAYSAAGLAGAGCIASARCGNYQIGAAVGDSTWSDIG